MIASETPVVRHLIAFLEIVSSPDSRDVTLRSLTHAIVRLPGEPFPCIREQLALYALLTNGRGDHELTVEVNDSSSQTILDVADNLPELVFELSEAVEPGLALGTTNMPVTVLPEVGFDLASDGGSVELRLSFCVGFTAEEVATDLFRLYAAINRLDLSYGGSGLSPGDAISEQTSVGEQVRITLIPTNPSTSPEQLARLVQRINQVSGGSDSSEESGATFQYQSIKSCAASVFQAAA